MKPRKFRTDIKLTGIATVLLYFCCLSPGTAYETWSDDPETDTGNCATCHGKFGFVGEKYTSLTDSRLWPADLMTGHGMNRLVGCMECHRVEGDQPEIARCGDCHGRDEDGAGGLQRSAGLRQHHRSSGIGTCNLCHGANEVTVGEHIVPTGMAKKSIEPCKDNLDNDGDGLRDSDDPDCSKEAGLLEETRDATDH